MNLTLAELTARVAQPGRIVWIGLRPARKAPLVPVEAAEVTDAGLVGDHRAKPGKRALSLIQAEHLPVIRALAKAPSAGFADLRRTIAVAGLNLSALRGRRLRLGTAEILITGPCAPCSRMEAVLGHGGYTAMRGHGGVTAQVLSPGHIATGDAVVCLQI